MTMTIARKTKVWTMLVFSWLVVAASALPAAYADGPAVAPAAIPAFPGAEGGGMYTTGGRGGEVYEVTNLNDSGPGSLRDAVSQSNRTIVFRVSGNIELKSKLYIKGSNLTIAGQTAPGDGISVINYPTFVQGNNIIIRYIRFRMGDVSGAEDDAMSIRKYSNIIIDHCSFSWAIDEVLSPYENRNVTVQWSIIGEALTMSIHKKGRHGFGGLWGAGNSTYHHNLIVHNASRNPRFKGTVEDDMTLDYRNNVVYNWNYLSAYGGDSANINMINNYYKYGPDTLVGKRSTVLEQTGTRGQLYIAGNYIDGDPAVTADNWLGVDNDGKERLNEPIPAYPVTTESAVEAYESVLNGAGAILPKRDPVDARIVSDVRNRTGRHINTPPEVGGFPELKSAPAPADSDHDGMPDDWELSHGLNPADPSDRNGDLDSDGYTNLEQYLNSITGTGTKNPEVRLTAPAINTLLDAGSRIELKAEAADPDGEIAKVEFYANDVKLGEDDSKPYRLEWTNVPEGTYYVRARAIDDSGTATDSSTVPVHVNAQGDISPWQSADVGQPGIPGHANFQDGVFTVKGAGNWREDDSFHFVYRKLKGDGMLTARIDKITDTTPNNRAGVVIRESFEPLSREAMMALSVRGEAYVGVFYSRSEAGAALAETPPIAGLHTPYWVRIAKSGDTVSGYLSADGINWTLVSSMTMANSPEVWIGMAAEAAEEDNEIDNYNASTFSNVVFDGQPVITITNPRVGGNGMDDRVPAGEYVLSGTLSEPGTVWVNGEEAPLADDLSFQATVELRQGRNRIVVTAADASGNEADPVVWEVVATRNGHAP